MVLEDGPGLEDGFQQKDDHHQPDEEDDAERAAEELEHATLLNPIPGECGFSGKPAVGGVRCGESVRW
jgi:hypothetical protein